MFHGSTSAPQATPAEEQLRGVVEGLERRHRPRAIGTEIALGGHHAPGDPREHPRRRRGHARGEPFRGGRAPQAGEHPRQGHPFHLPCAACGEQRIDMAADAAEGLPEAHELPIEGGAVGGRELLEQPAVEAVAVFGDPGEQFR
jgi:hypothetical protein